MRRVVVTGMGIVSSIGNDTQAVTASLREAKSGIIRAEAYAELGFRCQVHGIPKDLDVTALVVGLETWWSDFEGPSPSAPGHGGVAGG
jgi:3-oxoacyl-[acyl-carrier-protein] synthase-1